MDFYSYFTFSKLYELYSADLKVHLLCIMIELLYECFEVLYIFMELKGIYI